MKYNYHTHTQRCGHASGMPEEYIQRAIDNGIKKMGFAEHVPLKFADGTESRHRMPEEEGKIYCDEIKKLKEKYKGKIEISVGFEMEYYPEFFDEMMQKVKSYGAEYLILGQHYIRAEIIDKHHSTYETDSIEKLDKYVEVIISGMETGVFSYVAHPDIMNFVGDEAIYREKMREICIASKKLNIPIELNFTGIRTNRYYPNDNFWLVAGEEKSPVVFGFDSHDIKSAYDGESLIVAKEMVKKYKLNYIDDPELVLI